ncbi:Helitron helicase-like protein [Phytophthora palmivora]|uniref:Helitron helicase-like protein n=1 Tax=Phytophthora palmivora TaxID=4796 RepID=A0A2P4YUM6_9STRA|nr:Helitron helicase-like protein [Phytophthora palmivora]
MDVSGIPPHKIVLKVGMLIRMICKPPQLSRLYIGSRLRMVPLRPSTGNCGFVSRFIFYKENDGKEFPFMTKRKIYLESHVHKHGQGKVIKFAVDQEAIDEDGRVQHQ